MTKEEEKAIERLNRVKTIKVLYTKTFAMTTEQLKVIQADIETALNMLKEKDRQINSKNGTINALQCALKERTEERDKKADIVTKQDKIIDLMTKAMDKIQDPQVCKYCDNKINLNNGYCVDARKCKEGIKQYFERKSEECLK